MRATINDTTADETAGIDTDRDVEFPAEHVERILERYILDRLLEARRALQKSSQLAGVCIRLGPGHSCRIGLLVRLLSLW